MSEISENNNSVHNGSDMEEMLFNERIKLLYRNGYSAVIGVYVVGLFLVIALWQVSKNTHLFGWLGVLTLFIILRVLSLEIYKKSDHRNRSYTKWALIYVVGLVLSSSMWGIAGFLFFNPDDIISVVILIAFTIGILAAAANSVSIYYPAFFGFLLFAIIPLAINLFLKGGVFVPFGGAMTVYIIASTLFAKHYHVAILESLRLRFENLELVHKISKEKLHAEEANIAKSRFLAATSHDLRQPLHALGLFVSTLESEEDVNSRREILNRTKESVQALDDLFNSLLDISKLDAGIVEVNKGHFALNEVLVRLKNEFTGLAYERNVELNVVKTSLYVYTDSVLLDRILRNLISNAILYSEGGKVLIGARSCNNEVCIAVLDQGKGIPESERENVFSEFSQLHNPERDRSKGLGLGLAIVKRLCSLLQHSYQLDSEVGKGTVFKMQISKGNPDLLKDLNEPITETDAIDSKTILVIDDERAILDSMRLILNKWGCKVLLADTIEVALKQVKESSAPIDLVISDFRLRENTNGVEAIKNVQNSLNYNVNGILITGDTSPDILKFANDSGFPLLHKPVKPAQLKMAIARNSTV